MIDKNADCKPKEIMLPDNIQQIQIIRKTKPTPRKITVRKNIEELVLEDIHARRIIAISYISNEGAKILYHLKITPKGRLVLL